jgi:hypothetical protein
MLGYKQPSEPMNVKIPGKISDLIKKTIETECVVGIDTKFAQDYKDQLAGKIPNMLYYTEEGIKSIYVDAVEQFVSPSSYDKKHIFPFHGGLGEAIDLMRATISPKASLSLKREKEPDGEDIGPEL